MTTIGVNLYLWRASLDALSFMPLLQAEAWAGSSSPTGMANLGNPNERMKVTVPILDRDLRVDGKARRRVFGVSRPERHPGRRAGSGRDGSRSWKKSSHPRPRPSRSDRAQPDFGVSREGGDPSPAVPDLNGR